MDFFNDALIRGLHGGGYYCRECGARMEFEDDNEDTLVCPNCGNSDDLDHYGFTDEEYDELYPTEEEVLAREGIFPDDEDNDEDDEYEMYEEVHGELDDD